MSGSFSDQSFATAGFSISAFDFGATVQPQPVQVTPGSGARLKTRRKLPQRTPARADTWLELRCAVSASAGLAIHAVAGVGALPAIQAVAGPQTWPAADIAQEAALESTAEVNDVLLEILMMD